MAYTEREKEQLLQRFKEMLDSGDNYEIFETTEPDYVHIDPYPWGGHGSWLVRTTYTIGIKKLETRLLRF